MTDRALRVSFVHRDGDISIRSASLVNKRAPAGVRMESEHPGTGFWLELRDGEQVVYRRLVTAQFGKDAEVFGGGSGESFTRVALTVPAEVELAIPVPASGDPRKLRVVLTERLARPVRPTSSVAATGRGSEPADLDSAAERQHVDVALSDLVDIGREGH